MRRSPKALFCAVAGLLMIAGGASAQENVHTISAKPGAINYIEGSVSLNNNPLSDKGLKSTFLGVNDRLSTTDGKAEVLLTPGVFLRVGENSEMRMVSPSLTDTQVELMRGEIMLEATGLISENHLQVLNQGSVTNIKKNGLYRFAADNPPRVAVLDGKAQVQMDERKVDLKKGRQTILSADLKAEKFDRKKKDDLYAWSDVRSQYEAAASYRAARAASVAGPGAFGYGLGPAGFRSGWYWDNAFNSWAWLPGAGAFYNPFGYGFYSPGMVGYAPVVISPLYGGRGYRRPGTMQSGAPLNTAPVPVRPNGWNGPHNGDIPGAWQGHPGNMGAGPNPGAWHGNPGGWHGGAGGAAIGGAASGPSSNPGAGARPAPMGSGRSGSPRSQ